jgi:hypothetical protein
MFSILRHQLQLQGQQKTQESFEMLKITKQRDFLRQIDRNVE